MSADVLSFPQRTVEGTAQKPAIVPRGVWKGYHKRDGADVALAVDSAGRCLGEIVLHAGVEWWEVRYFLEHLLNEVDPVELELVP